MLHGLTELITKKSFHHWCFIHQPKQQDQCKPAIKDCGLYFDKDISIHDCSEYSENYSKDNGITGIMRHAFAGTMPVP